MNKRTYLNPGWKWSQGASFSQGIRVGDTIYVAGMAALDAEGKIVGPGDMKAQARKTFENIGTVLAEAGATLADVVKITAYVTDMSKYSEYAQVRAEVFSRNPPTSATVSTAKLVSPELLVEVEAIAYVGGE
jgi:2-iminobutanoate/2-iminopropanoate deaminase